LQRKGCSKHTLSPRFELWVYDRIQELLSTGETRLQGIAPAGFAATLRLLAEQWEKQEQINEEVRDELDQTAERLDQLESKIVSVDDHYYTIAGYCNLHKIPCPLHQAKRRAFNKCRVWQGSDFFFSLGEGSRP